MADNEANSSALVASASSNDIVIVADPDHTDDNISGTVRGQLEGMKAQGVSHLFLEHDDRDVTIASLRGQDTEYGRMIQQAESLGMKVHLYDDRSSERALDAKYPEESQQRRESDPYFEDQEGLVANAQNPERMQSYLQETEASIQERMEFRNGHMVENISATMNQYPGEKAVVMLGSAHMDSTQDVDEGLRANGFRTTTLEINSPQTNGDNLLSRLSAPDKPDFIITAEQGQAVSFKQPGTNQLQAVAGAESIPWQNQEPVQQSRVGASAGLATALKQANTVNCSWMQGSLTNVSVAESGYLAAPTCGQAQQEAVGIAPPR